MYMRELRTPNSSAGPAPTLSIELPARSITRPGCTNGSMRRPNGRRMIRSGQRSWARWAASRHGLGGFWADAGAAATASPASTPARARSERTCTPPFIAIVPVSASRGRWTPARGRAASAWRTIESGTPKPLPLPDSRAAAKMRGDHAALAVHGGPAGVARAHQAAQRGDPALHRPAAVGVLADHGARAAHARRLDVVGPVLRVAEHRGAGAGRGRLVHRQRPHAGDARHAQDGEVVAHVEVDRLGVEALALAAQLHRGVVLPGHHVRVGDHHAVGRHPARALHAQPARGAEHAHDAAPRGAHLGVAGDRRVGRRDARVGAGDRGERVEPGQRLQQRPRRRQHLVQAGQHRRALDRLAQAGRARGVQRHGARDPHQAQAEARHQHGAAQAVEHPQARRRGGGAAGTPAAPAPRPGCRRPAARPPARTPGRRATPSPPRAAWGPGASP